MRPELAPGWTWPLRFDLERDPKGYECLDGIERIRG